VVGSGAGLVGSPLSLGDGLIVAPFAGQIGRFLSQVRGFVRLVGGLFGVFGPLSRLLGQVVRPLGQPAGLVGLLGLLAGERLGLAGPRLIRGLTSALFIDQVVVEVISGVVLVLHRVPGHAIRLAGLRHALAGGDLPGFVLSHDRFFPGETARVCSPW
jgi:hypothetical protein